jgi:hypothetical protein
MQPSVQAAIREAVAPIAAADEEREKARPAPTFDLAECYGLVGDYVRLWEPHTEASPVAIYAAALAACGALIGRGPSWEFGNVIHHARLFVQLVGYTSSGRKGTALSLGVHVLLAHIDSDFAKSRKTSGLSSAEGLIAEIRDGSPEKALGNGRSIPADPGVVDKRLCVVESEFGGPFEAMRREGNRLSSILRALWDGDDVKTMVKHDPQRATQPHVTLVGAITPEELRLTLSSNSVANGFANRFLPIWSARSRFLPEDSAPNRDELSALTAKLARAIGDARRIHTIRWSPEAKAYWAQDHVYPVLSEPKESTGVLNSLLARGAPYVRRICILLAVLDGTGTVSVQHLTAALALWEYAAESWRFIYGDTAKFSALAQTMLDALREAGDGGLTKSAIRESVIRSHSVSKEKIDAALGELTAAGLAVMQPDDSRGGRRAERWFHSRFAAGVVGSIGGEKGEKGENTLPERFSPISPIPPDPSRTDWQGGPGLESFRWPEEAA